MLDETEIVVTELPKGNAAAKLLFEQNAELIVRGWADRKALSASEPESANDWLKRNAYRLIRAYVDADRADLLLRDAQRSGRNQIGLDLIRDNPFKLALFVMDEDLGRNNQKVFGDQMLYAHRHDVAPEHLIGFIRVAGKAERIAEKLRTGFREPGFHR